MKFVNVIGGSNSGKSHFSRRLSKQLGLAYIELDAINWKPNWQMASDEVFRKEVSSALNQSSTGWVVDGSYRARLDNLVLGKADTIIFLRIPLYITLPRQLWRSLKRSATKEKLWSGNQETIKNSLLLTKWLIKSHRSRFKSMDVLKTELRNSGKEFIVFRSNKAADKWLNNL